MSDVYILDACALIALLKDEKGADIVSDIYEKADRGEVILYMNRVNLFEVYYGFYKEKGKDYAEKIMNGVTQSVVSVCEFNKAVFKEAGRLKANYKISLADSIALAQAAVSNGALVTADHHEFDAVEKQENIEFEWIR